MVQGLDLGNEWSFGCRKCRGLWMQATRGPTGCGFGVSGVGLGVRGLGGNLALVGAPVTVLV